MNDIKLLKKLATLPHFHPEAIDIKSKLGTSNSEQLKYQISPEQKLTDEIEVVNI